MIKKIKIRGVQSHKDTELELDPGFNVITGASDSGKSAVVRSSDLVVENKPTGWDYKSWFKDTKESSVTIEFDDVTVERRRSNSFNGYLIGEEKYEAAGKGLPPEQVLNATRMNGLNLDKQHDPYFMLQSSPGQVASMLNEIAGLEIIDKVTGNIEDIVRTTNSNLETQKDANVATVKSLESLAWLEEAKPLLLDFNNRVKEIEALATSRYKLKIHIEEYNSLKEKYDIVVDTLAIIEEPYQQILRLAHEINQEVNEQSKIMLAVAQYKRYEEQIKEIDKFLMVEPEYKALTASFAELDRMIDNQNTLLRYIHTYKILEQQHASTISNMEELEREYRELLITANICPFCGTQMDMQTINRSLEGL